MKTLKILISLLLIPSLCFGASSRAFDDVNDFVTYTNIVNVTTGDASWGMWARTTEDAATDAGTNKKNDIAGGAGYIAYQNSSDGWNCEVADGSDILGGGAGADKDGTWTFITCTYDATAESLHLWQDGSDPGSPGTGSANIDSLSNALTLRVGTDAASANDFNGQIAYGFATARVLREDEITQVQWFPCSIELTMCMPLMGDAAEIGLGLAGNVTGTVTASTTSAQGPPTAFGSGLPL